MRSIRRRDCCDAGGGGLMEYCQLCILQFCTYYFWTQRYILVSICLYTTICLHVNGGYGERPPLIHSFLPLYNNLCSVQICLLPFNKRDKERKGGALKVIIARK